ncbi:spore germination protein GerPC [Paenibacillus tarimensis]|uniref:spore germination protein GerPC n=1 Tax=Paenibacillus tarimensis TaxID=416012 RepID=UPI001F19C62F|nr:spore germination protein GerPC [Paenibacillus tarimensis]MCF2942398.1 spore germination protein GerPC [Paenibacillus tarimensis]
MVHDPQASWSAWYEYWHNMHHVILEQKARLQAMESRIASLEQRISELERKPFYTVERLEYHFDQLKIQQLEGTLNIGMTPPGTELSKNIDQLAVPDKPGVSDQQAVPPVHEEEEEAFQEVLERVSFFIDSQALHDIEHLEQEQEITLDAHHRRLIVRDIKGQAATRARYYWSKLQEDSNSDVPGTITRQQEAASRTIRDLKQAIRLYLLKLKDRIAGSSPDDNQDGSTGTP